MQRAILSIPALFGDHHTTAIRQILTRLDGVQDLQVSAASHQVIIQYYPDVVTQEELEGALTSNGYGLGKDELVFPMPVAEIAARHSAITFGAGDAMGFSEQVPIPQGRPLWPCPGFDFRAEPDE
jgi:copper chaperone CopZ